MPLGVFLVRVYGPDGRLVLERPLTDGEQTLRVDASAWVSGVYGVALLGAEGQYWGKVVVD